ncbi:unnamed protein product [Rotaria socialis]|uniref:NAD(P)(+)--arginine ADP-ribosyltransferase n=1 Tax=Rotaria socialis TaxID=392032 RepID=A0A818LMJ8_9BILA|nr:unnamed protein product [Rotaria socialis]CAF4865000.1 unnamed protein product [Rotaria socialis]
MSTQNIDYMVKMTKSKVLLSTYDLTADEAAAVYLYTMKHLETDRDISGELSTALRLRFRQSLTPWFSYLQLLIAALNKLPSMKGTIWRYARGHVADNYRKDCVWLGFSSCTRTKPLFEHPLNKYNVYTIFKIECINGKVIRNFSDSPWENEVLLLPDTYLRVIKKANLKNGLKIVYLQEEGSPHLQLVPPLSFSSPMDETTATNHDLTSMKFQSNDEMVSVQSSNTPKLPVIKFVSQSQTPRLEVSAMDREKSSHVCKEKTSTSSGVEFAEKKDESSPPDMHWLDCKFHDDSNQLIMTPEDLETKLQDPPKSINHALLNRVKGSMFGMALGDALGAHVKIRSHQYLLEHLFTDGTSMGLCLANSLVARRDFIPYDQLVRYKWWFRHGYMSLIGRCFDNSNTMSQSLKEFERRQQLLASSHKIPSEQLDSLSDPQLLNEFNVRCSKSDTSDNGALMRLTPVPLFFYRYPTDAVEFSGISGAITHGDSKAYDSCRYYGALIVAVLRGETKQQLLDDNFYLNHKLWFNNKPLTPDVMKVAQGSYKKAGGYHNGTRGKGHIVDVLETALWAFYCDEDSFEKGVLKAVNLGDDTDTTTAIYGQLAGAYYGFDNLPKKWISQVYAQNLITCLSKWIGYEGELWKPKLSMVPLKLTNALNSISAIRPEHTQVPTLTFNELPSSQSRAKEPVHPLHITPYDIYGTPLGLQSTTNSRSRAAPGLYDYADGTRSTAGGLFNSADNFGMPSSYGGMLRYRPSERIGLRYGGNMLPSDNFVAGVNDDYHSSYWDMGLATHRTHPFLNDSSHSWLPSILSPSTSYYSPITRSFRRF